MTYIFADKNSSVTVTMSAENYREAYEQLQQTVLVPSYFRLSERVPEEVTVFADGEEELTVDVE